MKSRFGIVFALGALLICGSATASVIRVPADQPTIQDGINAAVNGDTVLVAPGKYVENINFNGKAITVTSAKGPKVTIIDGNAAAPVAAFITKEDTHSVLNGFTLQNGVGTFAFGYEGGGISISNASPTVTNNVIKNNTAGNGGGIGSSFGSPAITHNTIRNNKSALGAGVFIGGATVANFPPKLSNNIIEANTTVDYYFGGGVAFYAAGIVIVENNKIINNQAPYGQGGGMYIVNEADEIIVQNLIADNSAPSGSQVYSLVPQSSIGFRLINNTIVSRDPSADAVVVADGFNTNAEIINNVIVAPGVSAALICNPIYYDGPPIVKFNDAWSPKGIWYGGMCAEDGGIKGNISANPKFVSSTDFELKNGSPAVGAGTTSAPDLPKRDLAGKPRIVDGKIDMGAYENQKVLSRKLRREKRGSSRLAQ